METMAFQRFRAWISVAFALRRPERRGAEASDDALQPRVGPEGGEFDQPRDRGHHQGAPMIRLEPENDLKKV